MYIKYITLILIFVVNSLIAQINVSVPDTTEENNKIIRIPIYVSDLSGQRISSYKLKLEIIGKY